MTNLPEDYKTRKFITFETKDFIIKPKVLGLDMDHTIIRPKSLTCDFTKHEHDWQYLNDNVKKILQNYNNDDYCLVIFTNQTRKFVFDLIQNLVKDLDIPIKVYVSYNKEYKKPNREMWDDFITGYQDIDYENSLFIGDALGRNNDFSDSDKQFAINCNLNYKSPEQFFNIEKEEKQPFVCTYQPQLSGNKEFVMFVGCQASGKTTHSNMYNGIDNYIVIHGDDLVTEAKIKNEIKRNISENKCIVLDSTNGTKKKREVFINLAKSSNYYIKVIYMNTYFEVCFNRNKEREKPIPKIGLYTYRKRFEMPTLDENIDEIEII